jgi:hypothetical protein
VTESGLAVESPDWQTLTIELHCPRCGYDLRLLPQPRCPECGLAFQWGEIIAAAEHRLECPLFEYHWRDRPVRSLFATIVQALLPWRLWRQTRLAVPPRVGPLIVLVLLIIFLRFAGQLALTYAGAWQTSWWIATHWRRSLPIAVLAGDWSACLKPAVAAVATAILTWLALQLFQQTITRQHVRQSQMLRVVILSWTALLAWDFLASVFVFALGLVCERPISRYWPYGMWGLRGEFFVELLSLLVFLISVSSGLSRYLQLRRGNLMGLVAVGLAFALVVTVVLAVTRYSYSYSIYNPWLITVRRLWPGMTDALGDVVLSLGGR